MIVNKKCVMCGEERQIEVPYNGYMKWARGEAHIQDAMPEVSTDDREMLMSGICQECWNRLFA